MLSAKALAASGLAQCHADIFEMSYNSGTISVVYLLISYGGLSAMTPTSKKYIVKLSDDDLKRLNKILRQKNTSETVANRIRILKDMDANHPPVKTYKQCASDHGISAPTITNVVKKFINEGLDATIKLKRSVNSDNAKLMDVLKQNCSRWPVAQFPRGIAVGLCAFLKQK